MKWRTNYEPQMYVLGFFLDTKNIRIKILTEKMDFNEMASIKEETARSFVSGRYSSGYVS